MEISSTSELAFLTHGGEIGALMRAHDWSRSPLGAPECWPQSLRSVVGLLLGSKFPMFVAWGPELGFLYNDCYRAILGAKHPYALGNRFQDIWAEIWDDIHPIVVQAMQGSASYYENLPLTMNRKGFDEQTWFTFSYSPVLDESGSVAGMFCVATETTEQVLSERHRIAELERLRALFHQAPGVIAVLRGPNHIFDIVNLAYTRLVGHRDILGKPVREALPEVVNQGFADLLDRVYTTGEPFVGKEVPVMLQRQVDSAMEKRFVNFIFQPTVDHRGYINGIFVEGSDVTDAVQAFEAVRGSEERLRQLANTIPHLAWMANPDGWIHWYNDRWYDYTGKTFDEMQGWGWSSIHHPDTITNVMELWNSSVVSGEPFELSFPLLGTDGNYRTFFTRVVPLRDAAGNIVQWFGTNTDVTAIEKVQEELRLANRRKDEFLAMLAHELRNPLAPIATAAGLLKLTALDEARVRKASDVISRQVRHMTELLDDLLDVSRVTRGVVTLQEDTFAISGLLAEAIEQIQALLDTKRHHLTVQVPEEQVFVRGDRTRLIQVFSNLLNNAAKYTPPEGRIKLRVHPQYEHVEVSVEDSGLGISATLLPHIFDLFTQAERSPGRTQGGLGLGLALVKSLVELQGGVVSAHSDGDGKGSRFVVRLPKVDEQKQTTQQLNLASDAPQLAKRTRVLIVDDNEDAAELLMLLLDSAGHDVLLAHNACDALTEARRTSPAVLFLDIGLPDMDGYELARQIRALPETAGALLVAVTGYGQPQDKELAMAAGFNHHLVKPANLEEVLGLLERSEPLRP
ncbi:Chemotaxis protein methyltransferase CheR [Janthinobacterium sp. CG23_2]|nr:Chemotaxis protein methyltransferase CheR [Janthinobacterium sp. CG23_2]CUU27975.1 Chemotaxis protein methyltransferase CheR [Janthinobacterium sp. CG23_2]